MNRSDPTSLRGDLTLAGLLACAVAACVVAVGAWWLSGPQARALAGFWLGLVLLLGCLFAALLLLHRQVRRQQAAEHDALVAVRERLQALSARLISAQEEERRRIARELHDETGQALTVVRMQLADLARGQASAQQAVTECAQNVDRAIAHIRGLSHRLRPPMLDDLGLADALEWVVEQQARAAGWHTDLALMELDERLPQDVETACFRICQEALTNAARYARASEVRVRLSRTDDGLELLVADNGTGFDLARYRTPEERKQHFGLVSMGERAALAGGRLEIDTAPGRGTGVRAHFALPA